MLISEVRKAVAGPNRGSRGYVGKAPTSDCLRQSPTSLLASQHDTISTSHVSIPGSRFLFVVNGIGRLGAHPQPTPPLFESLTLCAITIVGDCPGQAERSRPPTGSLSKTRGPGSLSAPSSPAQMRDLVGYCAEDVEKNVVDDKDGPWAYGKETEENLSSLVSRATPRVTTSYEEPDYPCLETR